VFVNGLFVAGGGFGTILTSTDGATWTHRSSTTVSSLYDIAFGNGKFVAVGYGGVLLTSPDAINWTTANSDTLFTLSGVAYGNGTFVAVASGDNMITSTDGVNWVRRSSGTTLTLYDVTYGNGVFVAVGAVNTILTSVDGKTWLQQDSSIPHYANFLGVVYANGTFVVVGQFSAPSPILTSPDGITWTSRRCETVNSLNGVAYGDSRFVVVGDSGTVLQSETVAIPTLAGRFQGTDGFEVRMIGEIGRVYRIQYTTDLSGWTNWVTFTNTQATTPFLDQAGFASPRRFYRAVFP